MLEVRLRLVREGRIKPAAVSYAKSIGMGDDDIADAVMRVRESRASLALQGAPQTYRAKPAPPVSPAEPTPEWKQRAGSALGKSVVKASGSNTVEVVKGYRIRHVVDQHGDKFGMHKRSAMEQFMEDASIAMKISVCDPNRGGGFSSPGSRLGGLGNVPQHIRDRHARHEWVLSRLSPELRKAAAALVTRDTLKPDGTPFSLEDFGAAMFPTVADKNRRWGAGAGAIWSLAGCLVFLYGRCPVHVRSADIDHRMEITG